jgi:transcriptional regulator with XRE-family HTH domain
MSYRKLRDDLLKRPNVRAAYDIQRELGRLGQLIQRTRRAANLRQQDLAAAAGVAQADISRMEAGLGERGPTFDTLLRLAHAQKMNLVVEFVPDSGADQQADDARLLREAF